MFLLILMGKLVWESKATYASDVGGKTASWKMVKWVEWDLLAPWHCRMPFPSVPLVP